MGLSRRAPTERGWGQPQLLLSLLLLSHPACADDTEGTGGEAGAGGMGSSSSSSMMSSSTGVLPTCDPHDEAYAPTSDCGVFVKEGASGAGTPDDPAGTLADAILKGGTIYLCEGTYAGSVTVDGVSIYGGLNCASWKHQPDKKSAVNGIANAPALTLSGTLPLVENLALVAPTATTPGQSSIGLFVNDGASAALTRLDITAGDGATGTPGNDGGAQAAQAPGGGNGTAANMATPSGGAASAVNACPDGMTDGGKGGNGGLSMNGNGQSGENGDMNSPQAGLLGVGETAAPGWSCVAGNGAGTPGDPGTNASSGTGATATEFGTLSSTQYLNAPGTDGGDGTRGKGGGGGGGSKATMVANGAGGGGGGAGGCGGLKGTGGGGGGSSIGIVSRNATLTLEDITVSLGMGGVGGKGGNGQPGQPGGPEGDGGGANGAKAGCDGGRGGDGGNGSSAGGGRGGHAFGVLFSGTAPIGTPTLGAPGSFGAGGLGGTNGIDTASPGADGSVATSRQVAEQ